MNNKTSIRNYVCGHLWAAAVSAALCLAGCSKDEIPDRSGFGHDGNFRLAAVAESMSPESVVTRASDPKNEAEREIKTLHVFLFGPNGKYLSAKQDGEHRFQGYQTVAGTSTLLIDNDGFADATEASDATVYVVANVEPGTFGEMTDEGYPELIPDLKAFENFRYRPVDYRTLVELPESGMPMVGKSETEVDLTKERGEVVIAMKALMARFDFSFKISSANGAVGGLPSLNLTQYEVCNMATAVPFIAPTATDGDVPQSDLDPDGDGEADDVTDMNGVLDPTQDIIYNQSGEATLSFYVFENLREPGYKEYPAEYPYPAGTLPEAYQCYKPLLARNEDTGEVIPATHIVVGGFFTDADGIVYNATCTIYLGGDPVDDFNVKRNHQYRNRVTIAGITRAGNLPGDVTFDARIDVEATNPYYISILRHKNMDAHFNVTPLDVYLFDENQNPTMDIEVKDPEAKNWVRIERVPKSVMESGITTDGDLYIEHPGQKFAAGTGKRKYFTSDLLTDPGQLKNNTKYEDLGDRDRIYIYVDENISTKDRSADLVLTYKENGKQVGEPHTITIEQHGLLKVNVEDGGEHQYYIYAEAYEEYLDYYDPLSAWQSDQVYDGLPWGPKDMGYIHTGILPTHFLCEYDAVENIFKGREGTMAILMERGIYSQKEVWAGYYPDEPLEAMELDVRPSTAAEYCYRKNKTDRNGYIRYEDMRWYLPSIRELENMLTTYYASTPEFQNSFYWSCAAAEAERGLGTPEATSYARATMAHQVDGVIKHKESGAYKYYDPSLGPASPYGKALRTTVFRIRAVYRPADDAEIE